MVSVGPGSEMELVSGVTYPTMPIFWPFRSIIIDFLYSLSIGDCRLDSTFVAINGALTAVMYGASPETQHDFYTKTIYSQFTKVFFAFSIKLHLLDPQLSRFWASHRQIRDFRTPWRHSGTNLPCRPLVAILQWCTTEYPGNGPPPSNIRTFWAPYFALKKMYFSACV